MSLPTWANVYFRSNTNVPILVQDVFGGIVEDKLIISCGCGSYPNAGKKRHFSRKTWGYDVPSLIKQWDQGVDKLNVSPIELPDFPGRDRQKGTSLVIDDGKILLCWGGFSYSPTEVINNEILKLPKNNPKGLSDGWALLKVDNNWCWKKLPDLPPPLNSGSSLCYDNNWIYLFGGCEYLKSGFQTFHDSQGNNEGLGARLYRMNLINLVNFIRKDGENEAPSWERLSDCTGTPRMNHVSQLIDNHIYVLGGISGRPFGGEFYSTVDCWKYNISSDTWESIGKTPSSNTNWQSAVVLDKRWIVLIGGAHTFNKGSSNIQRKVIDKDKNLTNGYGEARFKKELGTQGLMSADIVLYDVIENTWGRIDGIKDGDVPLPRELNNPLVVKLRDDLIIVTTGEVEILKSERRNIVTQLKTHLSNVFWIGKITKKESLT